MNSGAKRKRPWIRVTAIVTVAVAVQVGAFLILFASLSDLPPAEQGPAVSSGVQTDKTLASFDSNSEPAFAKLYPRESQSDREQVWDHCAAVSAQGRVNVPAEAASPSHTRVVLDGFAKNDPRKKASCTFWLTWETGTGSGYWYIAWQRT
ncbi:hypothetical protein G3T36_17375 [Diaminobutyricibacter tongyongensis]|uniref:Uncharacterized protein n=1 Tax=Leifsonia tongyongensis TaxID=1268043 RepID=A0A6L9Y1R7_9MICO|nr:hypothetical protein [Diaminobutyricibacter tongyongensis]NEN07631.1 hypothetical protein [Diaminobutyricibacter tongyongensis]